MNDYKEAQTAANVPKTGPILRIRNRHLRDVSRQSRSTFPINPSCGDDGFGSYTESTRSGWRRSAEKVKWKKTMGSPTTIIEYILQRSWLLMPYTALVTTAILVLVIFYHA